VRLFERGGVYRLRPPAEGGDADGRGERDAQLPIQREHLGALLVGDLRPASWRDPRPPAADFYAAKGVLATLMEALRVSWSVEAHREPFLHPGRSARVLVDGRPAGWLGELHPSVSAGWDVERAAGFELEWEPVARAAVEVPAYRDLTSFPAIRQDLAVIVADDVPAAVVVATIRRAGGDLLRRAEVFDVYRGDQVGTGRASLAVRLEFRADDRTLTDEEVATRRAGIVDALASELGAELRG
jgi:phenylalanyl-tRNA synthetase beta chain